MQELDAWLNEVLKHLPIDHLDEAKQAIKDKTYESYKNGIETGKREKGGKQWNRAKGRR